MFKNLILKYKVWKLNRKYYSVVSNNVQHDYITHIVSFLQNGNGKRKVTINYGSKSNYTQNKFKESTFGLKMKAWAEGDSDHIPIRDYDDKYTKTDTHFKYYVYRGQIFRKEIKNVHNAGNVEVIDYL